MEKLPITLCVITHNSADRIKSMLERHKGIVSEILVVVQDSDDNTYELASEVADVVIKRRKKGASDPDRNWLFSMASYPWVLYLDDDEYLDKDLIKALPELMNDNIDVYWLMTRNLIDGIDIKKILGDDPHPRLFKKNAVTYTDQETNVDHTFPKLANGAMVAYVNYHIVHDRTYDKMVKSNKARNRFCTEQQRQMQDGFIRSVDELLGKNKD